MSTLIPETCMMMTQIGSRAPPIEFDQAQMLVAHPSKASSGEFTIQSTMSAQPLTGEDIPSSGLEARTKLLKRSDWLELSLFRPLKFEFPSADEKAQIGRRRRMSRRKKNQLSDAKILNLTSQLGKRKRSLQQTASAHSLIQSTQNDKRTKSHIPTTPNKSSTSSQRLNTSNADPNIRADVESFLLLSDPERSAYYLEESDFSGCEIREILMDLPSLQVLTASGVTSFDDLQVPSHELEQCLSLTLVEIVAHQSPRTRNACLQDSKSAKSSPFASDLQQEKSSSLPESSNSKLSHLDLKEAEE